MASKIPISTVTVVGAGIGGLYASYLLAKEGFRVQVVERSNDVGGLGRSIHFQGYQMDIGPHYLSLHRNSNTFRTIQEVMGERNLIELKSIDSQYTGLYRGQVVRGTNVSLIYALRAEGIKSVTCGILSFVAAQCGRPFSKKAITPCDLLVQRYGRYLFERSSKPTILHAYGTLEVSEEYVNGAFPKITFGSVFQRLSRRVRRQVHDGSSVIHFYPRLGMGSLAEALKNRIVQLGGAFYFGQTVESVERKKKLKTLRLDAKGQKSTLESEAIVYTTPLPTETAKNSNNKSRSFNCLMTFLCVGVERIYDGWVIGDFDNDKMFFRMSQQSFLSLDIAPKGKSLLCVETRCQSDYPLWRASDNTVAESIIKELKNLKILKDVPVEHSKVIRIPGLYQVHGFGDENVNVEFLDSINSYGNEFLIGAPKDAGTVLVDRGKGVQESWLGGVHYAFTRSEMIAESIGGRESRPTQPKQRGGALCAESPV